MEQAIRQALDGFFRDSEQKAYLMAMALTKNHHDALELVQDSMLKLVQKYPHRNPEEWAPLFYRILQNAIRDWFRKQKFRQLLTGLVPWQADAAESPKSQPQRKNSFSSTTNCCAWSFCIVNIGKQR
jgi:RNA polymerase sigma-70 factor (ECF subfamily)